MNRTRTSTELAPEADWFKSSYSSGAEGNCVEAAELASGVGIRDSKDKTGPALIFPRSSWSAFVTSLRAGKPEARA